MRAIIAQSGMKPLEKRLAWSASQAKNEGKGRTTSR